LVTTSIALWSWNQPVNSSVTIIGTRSIVAYNSTAYTALFNGSYSYGEAGTTAAISAPQAIFLRNQGEMPLKISWNASGMPTGLTILGFRSGDGVNNGDHTSWTAFAANTPLTLNPSVTLDISFNIQTVNVAFGAYAWATVIWATDS